MAKPSPVDKSYKTNLVDIRNGDCLDLLRKLPESSIDFIVTDPPYFLDQLGDEWNDTSIVRNMKKAGAVGGLPVGMKFDKQQGRRLERFFFQVANEAIRVLKPGGFMVAFSQGRLVHRLAIAAEDAGFEIRDLFVWEHEGGQGKAFTQDHFVKKMELPAKQRAAIIAKLDRRKTPQLRPKFEPMILAQKPKTGTFVDNWLKRQTGLVKLEFERGQQSTIFSYKKPHKNKEFEHMTIKPEGMIRRLIEIFTLPGQVVLDPFLGSGTAAIAAIEAGRHFVGFEIESKYFLNTIKRIQPYETAR